MSIIQKTATEQLALLNSGELTSVELTQAYLNQIEQVDDQVGAFLRVETESALAQAAAIDQKRATKAPLGKLAGLPVAIKDILCTKDTPTTEGLAEYLPYSYLEGIPRDDHGHIAISQINLCQLLTKRLSAAYQAATGKTRKINGLQLGYEARCTQPTAFDVMLGSQLGVGAFRALVEEGLNGVMVSVKNQFDLRYVPFEELVDPENLVTMVRYIKTDSDFHQLARYLEQEID